MIGICLARETVCRLTLGNFTTPVNVHTGISQLKIHDYYKLNVHTGVPQLKHTWLFQVKCAHRVPFMSL